ncbi:MAG: ABC transporter substrate-binding protein [Alphaproteobacteria bacterium]
MKIVSTVNRAPWKRSLVALAALAALAVHGADASAQAKNDYVLGVILANTGPLAISGQLELKGAKLRVDEINAAGGINGHKIRLEVVDNKSDPQSTVSGVRTLLSKGIIGLIGPESTGLGTGVTPLVNAAKIPQISLQGGIDLNGSHGYVFGIHLTGSTIVKASIARMKKNGITKIGYLTTSDALGQAGDKFGMPLFAENGIQIVGGKQTIDPTGSDFTTQLAAVKAAGAQSVFIWATGAPNVVAAKGFKALNMAGKLYLLNMTAAQVAPMGDATSVVLVGQTKANVFDEISPNDPVYKNLKMFVDAAKKAGVEIDTYPAVGYGAVVVFEDALRKVGPNPQKIYELWNGGYEPPTTVARIKWNKDVHQGFNPDDLVITSIEPSGKFKIAK